MRNSVVFFSPWSSCSRLLGQKSPAAEWTGAVSDRVGNIRFAFARRPRRVGHARRVERGRGEDASEKTRNRARRTRREGCVQRATRANVGIARRRVASRERARRDAARPTRVREAAERTLVRAEVQHGVAALDVLQGVPREATLLGRALIGRDGGALGVRLVREVHLGDGGLALVLGHHDWRNFTDASRCAAVRSALVGARACVSLTATRRRRERSSCAGGGSEFCAEDPEEWGP